MADATPKLETLAAGRGLAALAVVLFHTGVPLLRLHPRTAWSHLFDLGFPGVDFFFVLSGFLMVWVHARDFNQPRRLAAYARKRIVRIYPLYWLVVLAMLPIVY